MKIQPSSSTIYCAYLRLLLKYNCPHLSVEEVRTIFNMINRVPIRKVERANISELKKLQKNIPFIQFLKELLDKSTGFFVETDHNSNEIHIIFNVNDQKKELYIDTTKENWEEEAHVDLFLLFFVHLHPKSMGRITLIKQYIELDAIPA